MTQNSAAFDPDRRASRDLLPSRRFHRVSGRKSVSQRRAWLLVTCSVVCGGTLSALHWELSWAGVAAPVVVIAASAVRQGPQQRSAGVVAHPCFTPSSSYCGAAWTGRWGVYSLTKNVSRQVETENFRIRGPGADIPPGCRFRPLYHDSGVLEPR